MIRTLIFIGLMATSMSKAPSCSPPRRVQSLEQAVREDLEIAKKQVSISMNLTNEKVKRNELDSLVGNEIYSSLVLTLKQFDTLIATSFQLERTGTREEILEFAYQSNQVVENTLNNLKALRDLYDISTYVQFNTAAFFPADSFSISPEKVDEAKKATEPVAQRIIRFFADHPRQKFEAVIAYSSIPDGQEQNAKLCEGRARTVANLLVDQIRSKAEYIPNPEWIRYEIKQVDQKVVLPYSGKGRSTVSILWNMLPASLYAGSSEH